MSCLAATTVAHFKKCVGGFYLYPAGTRGLLEDFIYTVTGKEGEEPNIEVGCSNGHTFSGRASEFIAFVEAEKHCVED
jgi:hypothetical protein